MAYSAPNGRAVAGEPQSGATTAGDAAKGLTRP
jgi:hypothetical protein